MVSGCAVNDDTSNIEGTLEVHYINVGQADSIFLKNSNQTMLIDSGDSDGYEVIIPYLNKLGIKKIDTIVFTHPHKDHIGSGSKIVDSFDIGNVYMSSKVTNTKTFENLLDTIELKGIDIIIPEVGEKIDFGSCDVTILGPVKEYKEINDNSLVLKVKFGNSKFIFTGDMEEKSEKDIVETGLDLSSDVLKVAHHGSDSSSSYVFLKEVNPKYAVISCGIDNSYNHPNDIILSRLNDVGAEVFRTDKLGTIVAISDGENITFNQEGIKSSQDYQDSKAQDTFNSAYIGNINSKKIHLERCKSLPDEKNRVYFNAKEEAINKGFSPCSQCNP